MAIWSDFFDIALNLQRMEQSINSISGLAARVLLVPVGAAALFFGWLGWQFDLASTHYWARELVLAMAGSATGWSQTLLPAVLAIAAFIPTVLELFLTRIARAVLLVRVFIVLAVGFDWLTDWPVVSRVVDQLVAHHHLVVNVVILTALKLGLTLFAIFGLRLCVWCSVWRSSGCSGP